MRIFEQASIKSRHFRRLTTGLLATAVLIVIGIGGWWMVRPDPSDAKGPRYVLWKLGAFPFRPEVAYSAMVGDVQRDALVVGLTTAALEYRFGRLRARAEATVDYQKYYSDRFFLDREIRWLGDIPWLVVLDDGRATELHLMKG